MKKTYKQVEAKRRNKRILITEGDDNQFLITFKNLNGHIEQKRPTTIVHKDILRVTTIKLTEDALITLQNLIVQLLTDLYKHKK